MDDEPRDAPGEPTEKPVRDWEERGRAEGFWAGEEKYGETPAVKGSGSSGRAVASMVLGIFSLVTLVVCCGGGGIVGLTLAIVAWVLARNELADIAEGTSSPGGTGMARAGLILGIIGTVVNGFVLIGFVLFFFLVAVGSAPLPS